jgi:hypothetical protein
MLSMGLWLGTLASATVSVVDHFFTWFFKDGGGGGNGKP